MTEAELQAGRAKYLSAWEAANQQADADYWKRTQENVYLAQNPLIQKQMTEQMQTTPGFNPRSLIPSSVYSMTGFTNPDPTGPAYQGAPPPPGAAGAGLPQPAPQTATTGSQPAAQQNIWAAQPKPATTASTGNAMTGRGGMFNTLTGNTGTPLPSLPISTGLPAGFNIRTGSTDPTDPTGQNRLVYGDNYFPGGLPGFEHITNAAQFNALTPEQQGSYREALYLANQRRLGADPQPGQLPVPALPGDPYGVQEPGSQNTVGPGGVWQGTQGTGVPGYQPTPTAPTTPTTPGGGGAPTGPTTPNNPMTNPGNYPGGRGNYMGYGPNGGGLRIDPNYMPENWNYEDSPEFQWQLQQGLRGANRRLLAMGRSDSTGGINALNNFESNLRAAEVDKAYQRAVQANMTNYGRMFGSNVENYGRTRSEDQTGWDRAAYLDNVGFRNQGRDFNQNYQLADLGFRATQTGVQAGNATGANLANLLSQNGANQASLALQSGAVSADQIQGLLNAGWTWLQIEGLFGNRGGAATPAPLSLPDPTYDPSFGTGLYGAGGNGSYEYDFFA